MITEWVSLLLLDVQLATIKLIKIPRWDFRWQYFYTFQKPVKLPKGTTIIVEAIFDNTKNNPNNPNNPPKTVSDKNGSMKTSDEMFQFIITWMPYKLGDEGIDLTPNPFDK